MQKPMVALPPHTSKIAACTRVLTSMGARNVTHLGLISVDPLEGQRPPSHSWTRSMVSSNGIAICTDAQACANAQMVGDGDWNAEAGREFAFLVPLPRDYGRAGDGRPRVHHYRSFDLRLGQELREFRAKHGVTQVEVARVIGARGEPDDIAVGGSRCGCGAAKPRPSGGTLVNVMWPV
jgi:hypothetical protein